MLAWMNAEALQLTIDTGRAVYWSRSRQGLWRKGDTSGHEQHVEEIRVDCDQDAVLLKVRQTGAACHTGRRSCFYRIASTTGSASSSDTALPSRTSPIIERTTLWACSCTLRARAISSRTETRME